MWFVRKYEKERASKAHRTFFKIKRSNDGKSTETFITITGMSIIIKF